MKNTRIHPHGRAYGRHAEKVQIKIRMRTYDLYAPAWGLYAVFWKIQNRIQSAYRYKTEITAVVRAVNDHWSCTRMRMYDLYAVLRPSWDPSFPTSAASLVHTAPPRLARMAKIPYPVNLRKRPPASDFMGSLSPFPCLLI
jgi:hypothetical protein